MMTVYHGSYIAIEKVDLAYCGPGKDFGQGFYVTNLLAQAETWAERIGKSKGVEGVVTEFEYNENMSRNMKMKVLRFDGYSDEWLDFVVLNRRNDGDTPAHDYDIVEGPVADDRITTRVKDFMSGKISREQFKSELVYNPSHQICFCTVHSLEALTLPQKQQWINSDMFHIGDEVMQSLMSDYGISEVEAADIYYTSQTHAAVAEESTGYYQKPWQEIYEMLQKELNI
jgi:hypothetical protein